VIHSRCAHWRCKCCHQCGMNVLYLTGNIESVCLFFLWQISDHVNCVLAGCCLIARAWKVKHETVRALEVRDICSSGTSDQWIGLGVSLPDQRTCSGVLLSDQWNGSSVKLPDQWTGLGVSLHDQWTVSSDSLPDQRTGSAVSPPDLWIGSGVSLPDQWQVWVCHHLTSELVRACYCLISEMVYLWHWPVNLFGSDSDRPVKNREKWQIYSMVFLVLTRCCVVHGFQYFTASWACTFRIINRDNMMLWNVGNNLLRHKISYSHICMYICPCDSEFQRNLRMGTQEEKLWKMKVLGTNGTAEAEAKYRLFFLCPWLWRLYRIGIFHPPGILCRRCAQEHDKRDSLFLNINLVFRTRKPNLGRYEFSLHWSPKMLCLI
jgi:hypothetical protein